VPSESVFLPVVEVDLAFEVGMDFEFVIFVLRFVLEPGLNPPVGSGGSDFSLSNLPPNTEPLIPVGVLEEDQNISVSQA
jgi:hypothetical protein